MYTNGAPKGEIKAFIDYILSSEGQEIVKETGYIPLK
jgi:phosphate transport system substrate-binding protein